jgi:hypothetical protein
MQPNRLTRWFEEENVDSVPQPRSQTRSLAGFAVCPAMLLQVPWQAQLYQAAYEQARAAVEAQSARPVFKLCWN